MIMVMNLVLEGRFREASQGGTNREEARAMMQSFLEVAGARRNPVLGRCGARAHGSQSMRPGGVGAPPGGTMAPCQELADGRSFERKLKHLR